ncbi:hypothetical protein JCM6882_009045 [Rhodosporidiobolus microsporus]
MQTATLSTLPPEVLDLIFSFVDEEDSATTLAVDARRRQKVYHTLSQMSRSLYFATRSRLYSQPLVGGKCVWFKAHRLLVSLQANNGALGRIVRSLRALPAWVETLSTLDPETKLPYQLRGQSKAFSWMIAMIEACSNASEVGVTFATAAQTTKLANALSTTLSTLHTLVLRKTTAFSTKRGEVHGLLAKLATDTLPCLDFDGIGRGGNYKKPRTPFRVHEIRISSPDGPDSWHYLSFDGFASFLPSQTSYLRSLTIDEDFRYFWLPEILKLSGPHLIELRVRRWTRCWSGTFKQYAAELSNRLWGGPFCLPVLDIKIFSLFPRLEHLELHNVRTLSVGRLEALAKTSPSLTSLLCPGALWLADGAEPDRSVVGWNAALFPQGQLAGIFKTFSKLKEVNLGVVPFKDEADFAKLSNSLEEDRVRVKYALCVGP